MAQHVDQSAAPLDEKLRRFLEHIADTEGRPPYVYFHYDGFPRANLAADALAFLADMKAGRLLVSVPEVRSAGAGEVGSNG